ncbi:hypothetical protein [Nonomuraea jiangxiensis]|nr:hypothetical protein [Nonomuraea jiangxiensis]
MDLATGKILEEIPSPDGTLTEYATFARDTAPGTYLAVTVERPPGYDPRQSPRGAKSTIHRLTMDAQGVVKVQGTASGEIEGVIRSLAVSPAGEIAYARTTADKKDNLLSFAGVLGTTSEWPVEDPYRLYWSDENTLVFPSRAEPPWTLRTKENGERFIAGGGFLPTREVRTGAAGKLPVPPDLTSYGMVQLPDRRMIWATASPDDSDIMSLVLYDGPTSIGTVYQPPRGKIVSMTLDPTGSHLLVGHEIARSTGTGMDDFTHDQKLIRIDLRQATGLTTPATSTRRDLAFPQQVVWQGNDLALEEIAW